MSNETVIYKNEMNLVPLRNFNTVEIDIFFSLCNKLKEKGEDKIKISFDELKEVSNFNKNEKHLTLFVSYLEKVYDKMLKLNYRMENSKKIRKFVLFYDYTIDKEEKYIEVSIHPELKHILNSITGNFTKFELEEFTQLKSSYTKNMYRLLKQYKHTGYFKIKTENFRERLDIPNSYRMTDINKRVFTPIVNELSPIFSDLRINKIKAKKGRKIEWLEFVFTPEKRIHTKSQFTQTQRKPSKQTYSREKTPEWLNNPELSKDDVSDPKLAEDRARFEQQLKDQWED
ncbi:MULTISPECIES: replication initiation protein [Staphylococcus]|uniref:RepB family plasmid replication initiator protein n=1 Tax=Staphylococcus warneri TaxID=1292 RepID=A0AB36BJR7_STAWA|nr:MULTISPECIES: RepB family plasmid replication initiator protein [Staphylococcus]NBH31808.1 RepB family plasmid replication initiator protein [Staphylococcus warneri]